MTRVPSAWPESFFVSREFINEFRIELVPLTLTRLLKVILKNFIRMNYWRLMVRLRGLGFFCGGEGEPVFWRQFRWKFWRVLKERRNKNDPIKTS